MRWMLVLFAIWVFSGLVTVTINTDEEDNDGKVVVEMSREEYDEIMEGKVSHEETKEPTVHEMLKEIEELLLANKARERELQNKARASRGRTGSRLECLQELDFADWDDNDCPKI